MNEAAKQLEFRFFFDADEITASKDDIIIFSRGVMDRIRDYIGLDRYFESQWELDGESKTIDYGWIEARVKRRLILHPRKVVWVLEIIDPNKKDASEVSIFDSEQEAMSEGEKIIRAYLRGFYEREQIA